MLAHNSLAQFIQVLRSQVAQGLLTREQAQERLTMLQTSHAFQDQNVPQQIPPGFATGGMAEGSAQHQMATYSQQQQQQNGFASRVGQNPHSPGMGLPQGQGSLQQNFVQSSPFAPAPPSASQPTNGLHKNFYEMPISQLSNFYSQLIRAVEEGENNFNAAGSTGGESDMQRQALRAKLDSQRQLLTNIRDLINLKQQQGGNYAQQAGAPWSGAGQRATGPYSVPPERPLQNTVPSSTAQSNFTQTSPHVSGNGLPFNGAPAHIPGAPQQQPPQAAHSSPQQTIQCSRLPPLPEDRFNALFGQFANSTGLKLNDWDFVIDGRPVSPWALHRAVFARNGFDAVTANDEWPSVGAALGFPSLSANDLTQPLRCAPAIAQRLQQLYHDSLRHFEQAYINSVLARLRSLQASGQASAQPSQQQAHPYQPTEADYQALLFSIPSGSSMMTPEAMSILPRFSHTSSADLEAHRVPSNIVAFVERHRENLQRAAQDESGFRAGLTHPPQQQQTVQTSRLPPLSEDRFKALLTQFANTTGIRPNYRDFVIDGRPISPWALHRAVFARNGFDSVTANDEWPAVGAAMGFAPQYAADYAQSPRCGPVIAHRLQQLYSDSLRHFDQDYIDNVLAGPREVQVVDQVSNQQPPNE